jgi:hypothetical protein
MQRLTVVSAALGVVVLVGCGDSGAAGDTPRAPSQNAEGAASAHTHVVGKRRVPVAPSNLVATATTSSSIRLSWTHLSSTETGFRIERSTSATTGFYGIATTKANVASYSDSGLTAGTTYYYRVSATNSAGNSGYSNVASATTPWAVGSIALESNTRLIVADGRSSAALSPTFFDPYGVEIPAGSVAFQILANGAPVAGSTFATTVAGEYSLIVRSGQAASNALTITAREDREYPVLELPVLFHVVHFGEGVGEGPNLSADAIMGLLGVLNDSFANRNGSLDPNAVDARVRFRLARTGPGGNTLPEPGIDRLDGSRWDVGIGNDDDIAGDHRFGANEQWRLAGETFWNPREYLNLWVLPVNPPGYSWATTAQVYSDHPLPGLDPVQPGLDVPSSENFGNLALDTGTGHVAIAHEVGHRLGLLHTFSYGCQTTDYAADTFAYDPNSWLACPVNEGYLEPSNIMDYTIGNTFTYDQRERIQHVLRYGVWISALTASTR